MVNLEIKELIDSKPNDYSCLKLFLKYQLFVKGIIYVLLISQLCLSTAASINCMVGFGTDLLENPISDEKESEEKENIKKLSNKQNYKQYLSSESMLVLLGGAFYVDNLPSMHYPDVGTPPPEFLS